MNHKGNMSIDVNVLDMWDLNMLFTYYFIGTARTIDDAQILSTMIQNDPMFYMSGKKILSCKLWLF